MIAMLDAPDVEVRESFPGLTDEFQADVTEVCRMLADSNRLRIVFFLLRQPELNVTEICELLGQSQPAVSHHLALMKNARILKMRRDGKHNFYSLCRERFQTVMVKVFESILDNGSGTGFRLQDFLSFQLPTSH